MFKPRYKIEAGIHYWCVYRRNWWSPFWSMFPVIGFTNKSHAEQWIKEQRQ